MSGSSHQKPQATQRGGCSQRHRLEGRRRDTCGGTKTRTLQKKTKAQQNDVRNRAQRRIRSFRYPHVEHNVPKKRAGRFERCARTALGLPGPWPTLTVHQPTALALATTRWDTEQYLGNEGSARRGDLGTFASSSTSCLRTGCAAQRLSAMWRLSSVSSPQAAYNSTIATVLKQTNTSVLSLPRFISDCTAQCKREVPTVQMHLPGDPACPLPGRPTSFHRHL